MEVIMDKQSHTSTSTEQSASPAMSTPHRSPHKKRRPSKRVILASLLVLLCGAAAFGGTWAANYFSDNSTGSILDGISATENGNTVFTADEEAVALVAQKVGPSVVSIVTTSRSQSLFDAYDQQGAGTGIVVSKDGYIMTNRHVVDGVNNVTVVTSDGTTYENVRVIGSDPLNDVAFVKINGVDDLTPATLGDSGSVRIGQRVIAIGNALGRYQNTVTSGIVSGTGRPVTASSSSGSRVETLTDLIQTDAAINSGNSGGPLVNVAGQVIGINTAVATDANGIGFAIPINATKGILAGVLKNGRVSRAYLGVQYIDITPEVVKEYNLSVDKGAYVVADSGSGIVSGSPADRAGIRPRDIITKVNDEVVGERGSMSTLIGQYMPGDKVKLTIVRGNETLTLDVTLDAYRASN